MILLQKAFQNIEKESKDTAWVTWLKANSENFPITFLPNSVALASSHAASNKAGKEINYPHLATYHTLLAATALRSNTDEVKTFKHFYEKMAKARQEMSQQLGGENRELFGIIRSEGVDISTPVLLHEGPYQDQYRSLLSGLLRYCEEAKEGPIENAFIKKEFGFRNIVHQYPYETVDEMPYYVIEFIIPEKTTIRIYQLRNTPEAKEPAFIDYIHTPGERLSSLFEKMQPFYKKVKDWKFDTSKTEKENEIVFYHALGLLAWHLAQATFCIRGSAAITDMILKSLLLSHQFIPKSYKSGINIDLRAMTTLDPEEYARTFYYLFEGTPRFLDRFEENDDLLKQHKQTLDVALLKEIKEETHLFSHRNLIDSKYRYKLMASDPQGLKPNRLRHDLIKERILSVGHHELDIVGNFLKEFDSSVGKDKLMLFAIGENATAFLLAMNQEIMGESYLYREPKVIISDEDRIAWLNAKSLKELQDIAEEHAIFHTTLFWLEELPLRDRELLQEESLSRQEIIYFGVEGLKERLMLAKKGKLSEIKMPEKKEPDIVVTKAMINNLLMKLKYRRPHAGAILQEQHQKIENALKKLVEKDPLNSLDQLALEKGKELFKSLRKEFSAVIAFPPVFPEEHKFFETKKSESKRRLMTELLDLKALASSRLSDQMKERNVTKKDITASLRLRGDNGISGLTKLAVMVPHILPELFEMVAQDKEMFDEFVLALKDQAGNGLTALSAIICSAPKESLPTLWKLLAEGEDAPDQVVFTLGLQQMGWSGLQLLASKAPGEIKNVLPFFEKVEEGPKKLAEILAIQNNEGYSALSGIVRDAPEIIDDLFNWVEKSEEGTEILLDEFERILEEKEELALAVIANGIIYSSILLPFFLNVLNEMGEKGSKRLAKALNVFTSVDFKVTDFKVIEWLFTDKMSFIINDLLTLASLTEEGRKQIHDAIHQTKNRDVIIEELKKTALYEKIFPDTPFSKRTLS